MQVLSEFSSHKIRFLKTAGVLSGFLALGVSNGIRGPTLLDLSQQVRVSLSQISFTLTARAVGHALGAITSE